MFVLFIHTVMLGQTSISTSLVNYYSSVRTKKKHLLQRIVIIIYYCLIRFSSILIQIELIRFLMQNL